MRRSGHFRNLAWLGFAAAELLTAATAHAGTGPRLRELVEVADIEALAASPDGTKLAFRVQRASVDRNSYAIDWYVADLASGLVTRAGGGGEPIYNDGAIEAEPPLWSPDSRCFYYRALIDGAIGIWRSAADGSASRLVAGSDADVERLEPAPDGKALLYVTGPTRAAIARAERREYDEGILVDERVDPTQNLFRGGYVHGRLSSQRLVGRWFQRDGLLSAAPRMRHRLDLATLKDEPAGLLPVAALEPLSVSWAPPALRAVSTAGSAASLTGTDDQQQLSAEDGTGRKIACDAIPCRGARIVALAWRPQSREILFTSQDDHLLQSLYVWTPGGGNVRLLARGEGQLSGGRSGSAPCALVHSSAICVAASAASPPRLERIDLDSGRRTILFDPNRELRARPAPKVEQLSWRLEDGRLATGTLLFRPGPAPRRAPLFLNYYYCPGYLRGGVGDSYPFSALVDAGFVVGCLNVVPFKTWGDGADRERSALASVRALVRLLDRRGWIDPGRVGMGGFSAGSEATMWVAMNSRLLAAAAVASPQYEPSHYWMSAVRGRDFPRVLREFQQAGPPDRDAERWKIISPALNVDRIKAPLLMQLPEQEMRGAMELYAKLSNTSTPVEMYAFPDEAHVKLQPRHQLAVYRRNLEWFRYWLQGHVDGDPASAQQFSRWDALRRRSRAPVE